MELQHLEVLCDDVGRGSGLLVPQQLVVGLDDVSQLVGDIVLREKLQCSVKTALIDMVALAHTSED